MFGGHLTNSKIRFLKSLQDGEVRILESNLFYSMMVDGKKVFLKKLWLALMVGNFLELKAEYEFDGFGISW